MTRVKSDLVTLYTMIYFLRHCMIPVERVIQVQQCYLEGPALAAPKGLMAGPYSHCVTRALQEPYNAWSCMQLTISRQSGDAGPMTPGPSLQLLIVMTSLLLQRYSRSEMDDKDTVQTNLDMMLVAASTMDYGLLGRHPACRVTHAVRLVHAINPTTRSVADKARHAGGCTGTRGSKTEIMQMEQVVGQQMEQIVGQDVQAHHGCLIHMHRHAHTPLFRPCIRGSLNGGSLARA